MSAQGQKGIAIGQNRITAEMTTRFIVLAKEKITKLSAQELEERNMAWVPKGSTQNKNYVQASITRSATKVKKEKCENYEGPSRRFQHLWSTHYPYSATTPLMPMPWNSSSGMIGNPQWAYFNP